MKAVLRNFASSSFYIHVWWFIFVSARLYICVCRIHCTMTRGGLGSMLDSSGLALSSCLLSTTYQQSTSMCSIAVHFILDTGLRWKVDTPTFHIQRLYWWCYVVFEAASAPLYMFVDNTIFRSEALIDTVDVCFIEPACFCSILVMVVIVRLGE